MTGRKVNTVSSGLYNPGEYTLTSDVSGLTNGVYIIRMTTDGFSGSKRFVIAR
ncbi:MAG: T9SS type A sorting domain-containing protein [bacterium]